MENKHVLNRFIHSSQILGGMVMAGIATFWIARNFLAKVHFAILKVLASPFSMVGIKMHPVEKNGIMATLVNGIVYIIPCAAVYIIVDRILAPLSRSDSEWKLSLSRFLAHILIFAVVVFVLQATLVAVILLSGLWQNFEVNDLYWATFIIAPDNYTDVGLLRFIMLSLAYNTLIAAVPFALIHYAIYSTKENK